MPEFSNAFSNTVNAISNSQNADTSRINAETSQQQVEIRRTQSHLQNLSGIVDKAEKAIQQTNEQYHIRIAAARQNQQKELAIQLENDRKNAIAGLIKPVVAGAGRAKSSGLDVDPASIGARLAVANTAPTLEEQAAVQQRIATAEAKQAAETEKLKANAILPAQQSLDTSRTNNEIRLDEAKQGNRVELKQTPETVLTGSIDLTSKTESALQAKAIGSDDRIQRLSTIRQQINSSPEFLTFFGKTKAATFNRLDKFGVPITESAEEFLIAQTTFVRDSIENINAYIKEITGAQMSEKEATRLRLAQPDPGEDVFSGDGPIKFKAKLDGAIEAASLAQARSIYFLEKGITHDFEDKKATPPVSTEGMKRIVNEKGKEEARRIQSLNPELPVGEVIRMAQEVVQRRYGMIQ